MKLTVNREKLLKGLQRVASIIGARSMLPVLSNVLCKAENGVLSLTTTDLEIRIATELEADVTESGATTIPAKKFLALVSRFTAEQVEIAVDENNHINLTCGTGHFTLLGLADNDFPVASEFAAEKTICVKENDFKTMLSSISYAVSPDDSRKVLTGILLNLHDGVLSLVATDGKRLAVQDGKPESFNGSDGECIIPLKAALEVKRIVDGNEVMTITIGLRQCQFTTKSFTLTTKLIEGNYPNYKMVIPSSFQQTIEVPAEQLLAKIEMVSQVLSDTSSFIILKFDKNLLTIQGASNDVGEGSDSMEVKYDGKPLEISFNPAYLADPLRISASGTAQLKVNDAVNPVALEGQEGFLYVIMPIRKR